MDLIKVHLFIKGQVFHQSEDPYVTIKRAQISIILVCVIIETQLPWI